MSEDRDQRIVINGWATLIPQHVADLIEDILIEWEESQRDQ